MVDIDKDLPQKGKDIIGIDSDGRKHYLFRCDCDNENCNEWRDSLTGFHVNVNIIKWKYDQQF